MLADLRQQPALRVQPEVRPRQTSARTLATQKTAFRATKSGHGGGEPVSTPGTWHQARRHPLQPGRRLQILDPRVIAHGGDIQQLVAQAFLEQGQRFGGADISLQNGGGVRVDIAQGDITVGRIYTLLPFKNTLVRCA